MSSIVRVSIENLAWMLDDDGFDLRVGLLSKELLEKGIRKAGAFGGTAILTDEGKRFLEDTFGATDFKRDEETGLYNARFQIDSKHLSAVSRLFSNLDACAPYEQDRVAVFMTEIEQHGIISPNEMVGIMSQFAEVRMPKLAEPDAETPSRGEQQMPTHRIFRIFRLLIGGRLIEKFIHSHFVVTISSRELETTNEGSTPGMMADGTRLQNNLFL